MFKDAKEELARLQDELLAEEAAEPAERDDDLLTEQELDELLAADDAEPEEQDDDLLTDQVLNELLGIEYRSYNGDKTDLDPQDLAEELMKPEKNSLTGLIVTAGLLTLGIFIVVCWWLIRYVGML